VASGSETKKEARGRVRANRSERSVDVNASAAAAIASRATELLPATPVLATAYQSMPTEPGTAPLIAALLERGDRLLLPRIRGRALDWVEVTAETPFARGPLGIMEPTGSALPDEPPPLLAADVLFLPGLSVDRSGRRLGQGGGYYDFELSSVPRHVEGGPLRVALLFDDEFVDEVPHESHDCVVDVVVTPTEVHRIVD
jgi:5-formyltetrahydrofolate cyclo-ligase